MNWKVGDEFWVDYGMLLQVDRYHDSLQDWKVWFPPTYQPFKITSFTPNNDGDYDIESGDFGIYSVAIYNKNKIVNEILKDL